MKGFKLRSTNMTPDYYPFQRQVSSNLPSLVVMCLTPADRNKQGVF